MSDEPELKSHPVDHNIDDLLALSKLVPRSARHMLRVAGSAIVIVTFFLIIVDAWQLTGIVDWPALDAALFVSILLLMFSNRRFRAWMWLRLVQRSPLHAAHAYAITPGGLKVSSEKSASEIRWTAVLDVKRTADRLFVFMAKRQAFIIPRRAFDSDDQFEAFAAAAQERWEMRHTL